MKILVAVHPETMYAPRAQAHPQRNNPQLLEKIVKRIRAAEKKKEKLIYLGYFSQSPGSEYVPEKIRHLLKKGTYFPAIGTMEKQFMAAKFRIMEDAPEEISVCGIGYEEGVMPFFELLTGTGDSRNREDTYELRSSDLGWNAFKWKKVYHKKIHANLIAELTDAHTLREA